MNLFCSSLAYSGYMSCSYCQARCFIKMYQHLIVLIPRNITIMVAILAQFQLLFFHVYSMLLRQCSSSLEEGVDRL